MVRGRATRPINVNNRPPAGNQDFSGGRGCLRCSATSSAIFSAAPASGIVVAADSQRHLISSWPSFKLRPPITTRSGMPIKSASLNFTPGR